MCLTKTAPQQVDASNPGPNASGPLPVSIPGAIDESGTVAPSRQISNYTMAGKTPTRMGRAAELLTGGAYDPTGGADTGTAPTGMPNGGPTKFGALLKIIQPMMEGAAVGGFLGKSNPGGGFGAAQNLFMQRRMMQMQQNQFAINLMKLHSEVQKNQAEAQWAQRRPMVTRTAPAIKGKGPNGEDVFMEQDPQDGKFKPVEGITPGAGPYKETDTDQGKVLYDPSNPRAGALPLTMGPQVGNPGAAKANPAEGSDESASEPSNRANGNVPNKYSALESQADAALNGIPNAPQGSPNQSPNAIAATGGGVPRVPPGTVLRAPDKHTDTIEEKAANALRTKHPDWDDNQIYSALKTETRKPDDINSPTMNPKEYRSRFQAFSTQLNNGFTQIERERQQKIAALGKQYGGAENAPDDERQKIEDDTADSKQTMHQRLVDSASAQGIDLGKVPDYRNQSATGDTAQAPNGAKPNVSATKVATPDVVGAWAKKQGISIGEAMKQFKAKGYKLQGTPGWPNNVPAQPNQ